MRIITAAEATSIIQPGDSVLVSGSGGGHCVPEKVLEAIEARFLEQGEPRDLTLIHAVGIGDRQLKGAARFRHPGMLKRSLTSALIDSPPLIPMALNEDFASYTIPQGVISQLIREMAAGRPGLVTRTGLHTFVDPRQLGGRQNMAAREEIVELLHIDGEEWLRFKPFPLDVVILRGTTADEEGNVSMEEEAIPGEMLSCAQAARRLGAAVIVQVKRVARRGTLPQRSVRIPGILVDYVVVDPEQRQTYASHYEPSYAGEMRVPTEGLRRLPFTERKIIARRAAMEIVPGAVCNLGAGISTGVSAVAAEEGILDAITLSNEQGFIGGAPLTGPDSGGAQNFDAMVDQPYQFDFYDGGGLDVAFLSFAEIDGAGNVNVSRFADTIVGVGGFINISQNARKVVFSGTFTAGGLKVECRDGKLAVLEEGRHSKFVEAVRQICYNGAFARAEGREALFVTERAVFAVGAEGLELVEIAPGVDLERDVLSRMAFRPTVSPKLRPMDARLFRPEPMGLLDEFGRHARTARSPRRTLSDEAAPAPRRAAA
ncbi:acyl CoA:acetate/3-ketoacid CoA transferase [Aureimonas jatrophae]|uniref:Acetate CoA-transferase YdiF n=1 Tax=Aureimonas jatrophae TaxID=1166073 RepID=A0A1H0MI68_9HYPH|nr:CoA-transferase [Aureimonas jatrophae]MBB3952949.1 propionate CoA-transferase [Aureimonas jatrophae]SDO80051.1 propionate CoA-transferase [Aureimonas jatrophae]